MSGPRFSRNHVEITGSADGTAEVGPTEFLQRALGADPRVKLDPVGTRVAAGSPFGFAEGSRQACHLYAPFALRIVAHHGVRAEVAIEGDPREPLLDEAAYRAHLATIPR